ncbi:CRTAC1 family protein [Planomonospora sp. ID67723]|uniref:CRTAC1 family protein n=1 Tax=Planomonospora sp. ID67723 TaxID=2738134 RepID=UPI0018C39F98|nr:CRTAC1 family protein [Planomonospora sp. ID67723]MBG0829059.1 CRTAC1 family protein [Planomonospora sp. ID67723]
MTTTAAWLRRQTAGIVALALMVTAFVVGRPYFASAAEKEDLAGAYAFTPHSIALPGGSPMQTIRKVNKDYKKIDAWISSVGAAIAMDDLDGDGLSNDLCTVDTRTDQTVVTPAPGDRADRYQPFALNPGSLPMGKAMAPMGCVPGDFNEDGRADLMVYLWGRSPILYLRKADATGLSGDAFQPTELVPGSAGAYSGPIWNTNVATVADFDGDGHSDIFIGNYFPDGSRVLDDTVSGGVEMNDSMSRGFNGGRNYFFRWTGGSGGAQPSATFQRIDGVLTDEVSKGWELGATSVDVDGDQLPELFLNNDFGPDRLLHNRSTPGQLKFAEVEGTRTPWIPKSKTIMHDSFKGMGSDAGDFNKDGIYDFFVSNITTPYGIQESNFHFLSTAKDKADLRSQLSRGKAPWEDYSAQLGTAWSGWGWDVKIDDFNNSGELAIAQATGFVKGSVNRWAQLQELASANDGVVHSPLSWPVVGAGADIAGGQTLAFFAKGEDGRYANISDQLGLAVPVPTRGIATGDANGDGLLDFAVARQFDAPIFYQNTSPSPGAFLGLRLTHEPAAGTGTPADGELPGAGTPVIGAQATVTTADGRTFTGRVDGGSGHSGKRSKEIHIGLGQNVTGPLRVHLTWRDRTGQAHQQDLQLTPGWHRLQLGSQAKEK